ncbi:hypothetical protein Bca52824_043691 [Brassica carinata]|uniref:protein-serine/threonine phosphatase n=1 Tax=Brassica carinata TaxID=52824 RepID=A0A8X7RZP6_BRACI|nr:hypothetical protein Bca52824_043691 [Brassica carinata]
MSNEIVSSNKTKKDGLRWMVWLRGWVNVLQEILLQRIMASHLHNPFPLPPLNNLTCIVTGSTSGIGSETARQLAEAGAHVVMAVRNIKAAHELIQQWQTKYYSSGKRHPLNIQAMELDLLSLNSVMRFSNAWNARLSPLHVLINNAGMFSMGGAQKFSEDGYEQHLQVNHLAPALLSLLLLPSLIRASQSRIISVNSVIHYVGFVDPNDLNFVSGKRKFSSLEGYSSSKLAQVMFNNVLSKRLPLETGISVLCLSPGVVQTNITRDLPRFIQDIYSALPYISYSPQEGCRSSVFSATDSQIQIYCEKLKTDKKSVCAFISQSCQPTNSSEEAHNVETSSKVWEKTIELIGLPLNSLEMLIEGEEIWCRMLASKMTSLNANRNGFEKGMKTIIFHGSSQKLIRAINSFLPSLRFRSVLLHWTCLMVCSSLVRSLIVQAGRTRIGVFAQGRHQLNLTNKTLSVGFGFRTTAAKMMMVDSSTGEKRVEMFDIPKEKVDDGGYIGGGWKNDDGSMSCGYCSFRGKRSTMEDFYDVKAFKMEGQTVCMFGIFDGHGGSRAAEYLKKHLFSNLMTHPQFLTDTKLALSETYKQTDVAFLESEKDTYRDDGSTASAAVLVGNHLYVANVGDSRTIVSKAGKAIALSDDHKPNRSDERKRIESAGGVIMWAGTWRVGGVLAMSRAFGNRMLKQFVIAEPEIQDLEIDHEAEFLVLASDGLWDVVPNEDAVSLTQSEEEPVTAARKLTDTAFARGSMTTSLALLLNSVMIRPNPNQTPRLKQNLNPPKMKSKPNHQTPVMKWKPNQSPKLKRNRFLRLYRNQNRKRTRDQG